MPVLNLRKDRKTGEPVRKTLVSAEKAKKLNINKCVVFFPRSFNECTEIYEKCEKIYDFKSASSISPVYIYDNKILIALCPLGGPAAANLMEELSFNGIKHFIACGTCGCIDETIDLGNMLMLPTSAIRDEGVSYHYLPASRTVNTNNKVNKALRSSLKKFNQSFIEGKTWTIDAMYRETPNRIKRRRDEGAVCVEMECASLASVAQSKNLEFGELLYFSDLITNDSWKWRIYDKIKLRTHLLNICIDAILKLK